MQPHFESFPTHTKMTHVDHAALDIKPSGLLSCNQTKQGPGTRLPQLYLHQEINVCHPPGTSLGLKASTQRPEVGEQQVRTRRDGPSDQFLHEGVCNGATERKEQLQQHWVVGSEERGERGPEGTIHTEYFLRGILILFCYY